MDRKLVSSLVLQKLSDVLVNESVSFLGLEDKLESIESKLREIVNSEYFDCKRDVSYDIEEAIDFLLHTPQNKSQSGTLLSCLFSLLDQNKLCKKLDRINLQDFNATGRASGKKGMGPWYSISTSSLFAIRKQLDVGDSIMSPLIWKVTALASQELISVSVRRQAKWVRDDMRLLHFYVKYLEYIELTSEAMVAWMEEVSLFSCSADDVIGLFLSESGKSSRMSQGKIRKEMDQTEVRLQEIIERFDSMYMPPPPRLPPNMQQNLHGALSFNDDEFDEIDGGPPISSGNDEQNQLVIMDSNAAAASSSSSSRRAEIPDTSSFDSNTNDIMELLLRDDTSCLTVSVVGMEGIGKTKLVKSIYENPVIRDHFPHCVWINWVHDSNVNRVMEQIMGAHYLNVRLLYEDWNDFLCKLRTLLNDFLMDKRYLIVIDGVSSKVLWNQLGAAFDGLSGGTRVIFIASKLGITPESNERNFTYRLQLWSDEESWALFVRSLNSNVPSELLEMKKREILRIAGGLPKAIVKLAELLARENVCAENWSRVLEKFNKDEGPWSGTLQEMNKSLPLYLRRCLFYLRFFPDHFEVPVRRLLGLWVAEGYGHQKNATEESPEHFSERCLIELVSRNIIQVTRKKMNGKFKTCRLPEALRVHWLLKAKEEYFLQHNGHIGDNLSSSIGAMHRLVDHLDHRHASFDHIHGDSTSRSSLYSCYRETVSFLSFDTREGSRPGEDVGNFIQRCISSKCFSALWVLDLELVYKPKLPKALRQLTQLRYFGLRSTYLEVLPLFINKLLKLQTLDLKHTRINTLPSSIWMMEELRHLYLDESSCCKFVPRPKGSCLENIQTLWGAFVDESSPVKDGLDEEFDIHLQKQLERKRIDDAKIVHDQRCLEDTATLVLQHSNDMLMMALWRLVVMEHLHQMEWGEKRVAFVESAVKGVQDACAIVEKKEQEKHEYQQNELVAMKDEAAVGVQTTDVPSFFVFIKVVRRESIRVLDLLAKLDSNFLHASVDDEQLLMVGEIVLFPPREFMLFPKLEVGVKTTGLPPVPNCKVIVSSYNYALSLDTFLNIKKLSLTCKISEPSQNEEVSSQLDAVANWIHNLNHLQFLKLKAFNELSKPAAIHLQSLSGHMDLSSVHLFGNLKSQNLISEFPQNLMVLTLSASGLAKDPMQMLAGLPSLVNLRLFSGSFTGQKMVCTSRGFPKLQVLKLWELDPLEEWSIEEGALPGLKCLEIKSCRHLKMLPDGLQHVKTLCKLKLSNVPVLSARIKDNEGEDCDKVAHLLNVYVDNC
ncbi:putative disease resistance protein At1g59780 [Mercurialis annua]|uniref:putative disease resistance protein At1g59780 n=1 Tax=Mercurialis annua TaxID=3986 RepID=UPI00215EF41D|nr:putative disease resistance protein At1g59780 [Mercurialis annua]